MHRHLLAACAAMLPFSLASVPANADHPRNCWLADELAAAELHNFQTMLMVGALKCRDRSPVALDGYNRFMNSKRDLIVANQYVLMSHFIREYGDSSGMGAFRDYETGVGNRHSFANNLVRCDALGAMSRMSADASEADLRELARVVGQDSLRTSCPDLALADEGLAPIVGSSAGTEPAAFPETVIAAGEASTLPENPDILPELVTSTSGTQPKIISVAEPETVVAAGGPSSVVADAAEEVAEASPASAEAVSAAVPAAAPTAAQALQEAARALALAATALQAEQSAAATAEAAPKAEPQGTEPEDSAPNTAKLVSAPE